MLSESDKNIIIKFAQKYDVSAVYLFGSSLNANAQARDIDLGVQGIEPALFFKFYGELSRQLSKEVDLVDLSHKSLFNTLVKKKGSRYMENLLKRVLQHLNIPLPHTATSHKDLLTLAVEYKMSYPKRLMNIGYFATSLCMATGYS